MIRILLCCLVISFGFADSKETKVVEAEAENFISSQSKNTKNKKEGLQYGKELLKQTENILKNFNAKEIDPNWKGLDDKAIKDFEQKVSSNGQNVVDSEAKKFLESGEMSRNLSENKNLSEKEDFFQKSEKILAEKNKLFSTESSSIKVDEESSILASENEKDGSSEIKCIESGDPFKFSFIKERQIKYKYFPKEVQEIKKCKGHSVKLEGKNYKKFADYQNNPDIAYINNIDSKRPLLGTQSIKFVYFHKDNISSCNCYYVEYKINRNERWEEDGEIEENYPDSFFKLSQNSSSYFISNRCLDDSPRQLKNGKMANKCWKEEFFYVFFHPSIKGCDFVKSQNATLVSKKCIKETPYGCAEWELTFQLNPSKKKVDLHFPVFNEEDLIDTDKSVNNNSFAKTVSKLAVLEGVKQELERSGADVNNQPFIFKGNCLKCTKTILNNVVFDCCDDMGGLANILKLHECDCDSKVLALNRRDGLCHYIGLIKNKPLGLITLSETKVFCCFPSKLSRVLQEQARQQLGISWGTPEEPNCDGLRISDIERLDFARLDLSECFEDLQKKVPVNLEEKLANFQKKLESTIKEEKNKKIFDGEKIF